MTQYKLKNKKVSVAVIGGGISGIGAAKVFQQNGYNVTIFEKKADVGGVWFGAYPNVHIQNTSKQYRFTDYAWPKDIGLHPTGQQILEYLERSVSYYNLRIKLNHEVVSMEERADGWLLFIKRHQESILEHFDYVIIATGLFSDSKYKPRFPGQEIFKGRVITEREIQSTEEFVGKRVVVYGYGKSALDVVTMSATCAKTTTHVFRAPRWTLPENIFGFNVSFPLYRRFCNTMITSWAQSSVWSMILHYFTSIVYMFWAFIGMLFRLHTWMYTLGQSDEIKKRIEVTIPHYPLMQDRRFVVAVHPKEYYPFVTKGNIVPINGQVSQLKENSVLLKDMTELPCDLCVLSLGNQTPSFSYMPEKYRLILEREGGCQLYRHMIHPHIPRIGFVGFNHSFLHIPTIEISALWILSAWEGILELPSAEDMDRSMRKVTMWKQDNIMFEPTRSYLILTRFQQYLDIILQDLGINPYRKMPNIFAELFGSYSADDYANVFREFRANRLTSQEILHPMDVDT